MPLEISSLQQLLTLVKSEQKATVVDFYATWCGPCRAIAPEYESMSRNYDANKVTFCKVDVDRVPDCARQYNVTAMPTFIVFLGGQVVESIRGANMAQLARVVTYAVSKVRNATFSGQGHALGGSGGGGGGGSLAQGSSSVSATAAPSSTIVHALANSLLNIQLAMQHNDPISKKDACDAMHRHLISETPIGYSLLPILMASGPPVSIGDVTVPLTAFFDYLETMDGSDGKLIVCSIVQFLVNALTTVSLADAYNGQLHAALRMLIKCGRSVRASLVSSRKFGGGGFRDGLVQGDQIVRKTLLGSALAVGSMCRKNAHPIAQVAQQQYILELFNRFPLDNSSEEGGGGGGGGSSTQLQRTKADMTIRDIQVEQQTIASFCFPVFRELLSDKDITRQPTLDFISKMLSGNVEFSKTMTDHSKAASPLTLMCFTSVLVDLALPVVSGPSFDPSSIPVAYVYDPNALIGFSNDDDVERVTHFTAENPLPQLPRDETGAPVKVEYAPRVHLFFAALRAVGLMYSSHLIKYDSYLRNLRHPRLPAQNRHFFLAESAMITALLGCNATAVKCVRFLNGVARWLLHVMGIDGNGVLPETVPVAWKTLPQCIVDDVIRSTKLLTTLKVIVDITEIQDILSLTLVLMGNSSFFPKPHTHALFPSFLVSLLNSPTSAASVQRHPWFQSHIVKGCILCYVAMEKSYYEKVQTRFELSHCLRVFLKENALCAAVRAEFEETKSDVLERFSHMVTGDINAAVDSIVSILQNMNRMLSTEQTSASSRSAATAAEAANSRTPQREHQRQTRSNNNNNEEEEDEAEVEDRSYDEYGQELASHIQLFDASIDVFFELSKRFPRGVAQNMVAQQISQMLARSITTFTGPKCRDLKINDAGKYGFRPRDILTKLVECLVQFHDVDVFLRHLCECGVPLQTIYEAMGSIVHRRLVREDLVDRLSLMYNRLKRTADSVEEEVEVWKDAPDYALDVLLSTPLTDPIAIPTHCESMDDLVVTNKATLHHSLLSESKNPYTNEYLDGKLVEEFNKRPDVAEAIGRLKARIDEWHREALARFHASKQNGNGEVPPGAHE